MAQLDHRIILSGMQADPMGNYMQGMQARNAADKMGLESKERIFRAENGQALYNGDANALAAYAGVNPEAADAWRSKHEARQMRQEAAARARAAAGRAAGSAAARRQAADDLSKAKDEITLMQIADRDGTWDEYARERGITQSAKAAIQTSLIEIDEHERALAYGQPSPEEAAMEAFRSAIGGEPAPQPQAAPQAVPQPAPQPEPMGSNPGLAGAALANMPMNNALMGPPGTPQGPAAQPPVQRMPPIPPAEFGSAFGPVYASPPRGRGQALGVSPGAQPQAATNALLPPVAPPQAAPQPAPQQQPAPQPQEPVDPVQALVSERDRLARSLLIPNLPQGAKDYVKMRVDAIDTELAAANQQHFDLPDGTYLENPSDPSSIRYYSDPNAPAPARGMFRDANERWRWEDDQTLVVPDLEIAPGFTVMTPEQVASIPGLDASKTYQMSDKGRIYEVGGGGVTVNNNAAVGETAFSKKSAELEAVEVSDIIKQGHAASRTIAEVGTLESLLVNSEREGAGASLVYVAANMGLKLDGASELEAAQAIISRLVPQQRPPGSGPMSDADLELFKQSLPRLINTAEGNRMIIQTIRSIAEYDMARGQIAASRRSGEVDQSEASKRYSELANPLSGFLANRADLVTPKARFDHLIDSGMSEEDAYGQLAKEKG